MKRLATILCAAALLVAALAAPANAIINGKPDGDAHPYVGIMYTEQHFCSGAAISPTIFLTAAHCIDGADQVYLSFDEDPQPRYLDGWPHPDAAWTTGTTMQVGDFCGFEADFTCGPGLLGFFGSSDVAVVVMDQPVTLDRYAQLPYAGQVDELRVNTRLTAIGYGVEAVARGGGMPQQVFPEVTRKYTTLKLANTQHPIDDVAVRVKDARSGTCSGDSGSPLLLGDTVLAVLSGGNGGFCTGQIYYARVDNAMLPLLEAIVSSEGVS